MIAPTSKSPGSLITLVHHRWNIPLLALLHEHSGAKHITLVNQLQLSRASLSAALEHLIQLGLVVRNTGYGHPMRPEYMLTPQGQAIGGVCLSLAKLIQNAEQQAIAYRKWTLPTVAVLGYGQSRFNELRKSLSGATPRALTLCLKGLVHERWAVRTVVDGYPPSVDYGLNTFGRSIYQHVCELA
jgi:DNA-binding HxlR family transcriptional regulator